MAEALTLQSSKLNSILLFVTLGVLAFIGERSWSNSMTLAEMKGSQMTRPEVESKILEVKSSIASTEKEIAGINLELVKLQARASSR